MVVRIGATHTYKLIPRNAELCWIATHILAEETLVKIVVTCWNRCVNSIK